MKIWARQHKPLSVMTASAPVVTHEGKLIARVTIEAMVDYIREESETEVLNMAGLKGAGRPLHQ